MYEGNAFSHLSDTFGDRYLSVATMSTQALWSAHAHTCFKIIFHSSGACMDVIEFFG